MSCTIEIYDIVSYRLPDIGVTVHTNLGYTHYKKVSGFAGLFAALGWQYVRFGKGKRKARYDSWLRDSPPECIVQ